MAYFSAAPNTESVPTLAKSHGIRTVVSQSRTHVFLGLSSGFKNRDGWLGYNESLALTAMPFALNGRL